MNGIDDRDVRNTFFPIDPFSLGCRPVERFGTERASWVSGLEKDLAWGPIRFQKPLVNTRLPGAQSLGVSAPRARHPLICTGCPQKEEADLN